MKKATEDEIYQFVDELAVHYPLPKHEDAATEAAWLRSMVAELEGASPEVLKRAARRIIQTRKYRNFPLVADCRQAVREAADDIQFDENAQTLPELRKPAGGDYSKSRIEFAEMLLQSAMGREAARDGWILALRDFATREQRLPDGRRYEARNQKEREAYAGCSEIEFCKRSAHDFNGTYDAVLRGGGGALAAFLERLGDSMAAKRRELSEKVLGR